MSLFGTDGIRGVVDESISSQLAYKVGKGIAIFIDKHNLAKTVIIGRDTRISGDTIAYSLATGLIDYGVNCIMVGIVPTACVSFLAAKLDIGFGVMITASHNTWDMNGIKIINNLGYKLSLEDEEELEKYILSDYGKPVKFKGKIAHEEGYVEKYTQFIYNEVKSDLYGMNIAIDTAYGSNYCIAPKLFTKLGANIIPISNKKSGEHINGDCGAQHVELIRNEVLFHSCDIGFAFDGDADRLRVVLNDGYVLDGDDILFIIANHLKETNKLNSLTVVGTVMTNGGVETSLKKRGIKLIRVDVGDRNVIECLRKNHYSLGGESSGHICLHDYNTTCDALFNALYLLKIIKENNKDIKDYLIHIKRTPQLTTSIPVSKKFRKKYDDSNEIQEKLNIIIKKYEDIARIVVRPSGTELVFRIMVESASDEVNKIITQEIAKDLNID